MPAPLVPVAAGAAAAPILWPWYAAMYGAVGTALGVGGLGIAKGWGSGKPKPTPSGPIETGRGMAPGKLQSRSRSTYGLTTPSLETGRNMAPRDLSSNYRSQYGLSTPSTGGSTPPAAPQGQSFDRTRRERMVEALGNAGVQQPLPPLEDLKPFFERPENQAMRLAATPGKEGYVAPGAQSHSDRADMVAWLEANQNAQAGADGRNIVDRYLLKEYSRGTLGEKGLAMARARGLVKDEASAPVAGIGPIADGDRYGRDLEALAGTRGLGPVVDGDVYSRMLRQPGDVTPSAKGMPLAGLGAGTFAPQASANSLTPISDRDVVGMNAQGQPTIGEGAYGYDATLDGPLPVATESTEIPSQSMRGFEDLRGLPVSKMSEEQKKRAGDLLARYLGGIGDALGALK